ncbi:MAG: hypothetical protein V6Z86_06260 [Hyphomicrobiales bacterium]
MVNFSFLSATGTFNFYLQTDYIEKRNSLKNETPVQLVYLTIFIKGKVFSGSRNEKFILIRRWLGARRTIRATAQIVVLDCAVPDGAATRFDGHGVKNFSLLALIIDRIRKGHSEGDRAHRAPVFLAGDVPNRDTVWGSRDRSRDR